MSDTIKFEDKDGKVVFELKETDKEPKAVKSEDVKKWAEKLTEDVKDATD